MEEKMKHLLVLILTSMFLLSSASANNHNKLGTIKEHCSNLSVEIIYAYEQYREGDESGIWRSRYENKSKIYHYLDCSDFR